MTQPLSGITVLDFTTLLPGPLATLMLAEAGADVIKIERPGGEDMRQGPPRWDGESINFGLLNRGKRSIQLDLKDESARARLRPLIEKADVIVEQFRPGVMDRLGVGYEAARKINPRIVYCSISGYGQTGPRSGEAGHDINYISSTGLLALAPGAANSPTVPPALIADIAGGSFPAVMNILLGLRQRDLTGQGSYIDIAMTDAMFTFAWHALATAAAGEGYPRAGAARLTGGSPRYQLYPTKDGKLVACGALEPKFWQSFLDAIGLSKEAVNEKDAEGAKARIAARIREETADHWRPILAKADCCATIVANVEEALRDKQFHNRGLFEHKLLGPSGATTMALPVPIAPGYRASPDVPKATAALGADDKLLG